MNIKKILCLLDIKLELIKTLRTYHLELKLLEFKSLKSLKFKQFKNNC